MSARITVPFYTATREYKNRKAEFDAAIASVLEKGSFILGPEVDLFEKEVTAFTGAKHAVGVASGSDGLVIGADILGFKDGAEVLTPTFTFFASTSCVARIGGAPVLVDVDENTFAMNLDDAERRLTQKTRGIIPVHLFLQMADMQRCLDFSRAHSLKVLEDAAEAIGMKTIVDGIWKDAGTIGDIGIYSFFPTKTLGGYGDAGMMITNDDELAAKIRSYRVHGSTKKYHHDYIGYNSRLDTFQAAILRVKLNKLSNAIESRKKHAEHYLARLKNCEHIRIPTVESRNREVYYVFNILAEKRDDLAAYLSENGIGWSIYYPLPLHLQKCFSYLGHKKGDFPVSEKVCESILALPMYPELTEDEIDYIADTIIRFFR